MTKMHLMLALVSDFDFDIDYVTNKIGVSPSSTRKLNDPIGSQECGVYSKSTEWIIDTDYIYADNVSLLLSKLQSMVTCNSHTLRELAVECNGTWVVTFDGYVYSGDAPHVNLPGDFINWCAEIQAMIMLCFDISYRYNNYQDGETWHLQD